MVTDHIDAGTYRIHAGTGALDILASAINPDAQKFILCDENTAEHCVPQVIASVNPLKSAHIIEVEAGESAKNIETATAVWEALADNGADRSAILINIGGGMVTDLGAFCASTYMRGISFVNIPTTVLSQADASFGGKAAIDLGPIKNLIGTFKDPIGVYCHPGFFSTLAAREKRSGFAEMIKHALIADAGYWDTLKMSSWEKDLADHVGTSARIKMKVVLSDPFEAGQRKVLNFGHTIGHALEGLMLGSSTELLHGEAVAAGIIAEAFLSMKAGYLKSAALKEITEFVSDVYADVLGFDFNDAELISLMSHDKKNTQGNINFTLIEGIGKAVYDRSFQTMDILEALQYLRKSVASKQGI